MGISVVRRAGLEAQLWLLRRIDSLARGSRGAEHLKAGVRGEWEALFFLRKLGYVVVARRWKSSRLLGDIDLVGWDGPTLCFVEVKSRSRRDAMFGICPALSLMLRVFQGRTLRGRR